MYEMKHRVRYSEISPDKHIDIEQVVKYFQDCSTFDSENIGQGLDYLEKAGYVWLLAAWQVEVTRYPSMGEEIIIATWPHDTKGILAYRNFEIRDLAGNRLVAANSIWFYMNCKTGIPKKLVEDDVKAYGCKEKLPIKYKSRKIKLPDENGCKKEDFPVKKADLDTNGHVNNARYIEMALEYIEEESSIISMRADYRKSAVLGDRIYPVIFHMAEYTYIELSNSEGEPYVLIEFEIAKKAERKDRK